MDKDRGSRCRWRCRTEEVAGLGRGWAGRRVKLQKGVAKRNAEVGRRQCAGPTRPNQATGSGLLGLRGLPRLCVCVCVCSLGGYFASRLFSALCASATITLEGKDETALLPRCMYCYGGPAQAQAHNDSALSYCTIDGQAQLATQQTHILLGWNESRNQVNASSDVNDCNNVRTYPCPCALTSVAGWAGMRRLWEHPSTHMNTLTQIHTPASASAHAHLARKGWKVAVESEIHTIHSTGQISAAQCRSGAARTTAYWSRLP